MLTNDSTVLQCLFEGGGGGGGGGVFVAMTALLILDKTVEKQSR